MPLAARAQQALPVIGYISAGSPGPHVLAALRQSLAETGYVDGRNVTIESHLAEGQYDRLPAMAAELVHRQVAIIVASPTPAHSRQKLRQKRFQSCSALLRIPSSLVSLLASRGRVGMRPVPIFTSLNLA
jgi:hypothetical protein